MRGSPAGLLVWVVAVGPLAGVAAGSVQVFFDPPQFDVGPLTFLDAGPAQAATVPNVATFNGGVILSSAGWPSGSPYATGPNLYATASFGDPSLQPMISADISPLLSVHRAEGLLYNGWVDPVDYRVEAYHRNVLVASQVFLGVPQNNQNGFVTFAVSSDFDITQLRIFPTNPTGSWAFAIDTVVFNGSIPAPSSGVLLLLGVGVGARRRRC